MKQTGASTASAPSAAGPDGNAPRLGGPSRAETVETAQTGDGKAGASGDAPWSIGELARELGVTTRTIRFYEARHLITPRRDNGARVYGRRDRARMLLILRGKNLGFSLEDIREYLSLYDADPTQVAQTQLLLAKVQSSIDDLERKRIDLDRTIAELRSLKERANAFLATRRAGDR